MGIGDYGRTSRGPVCINMGIGHTDSSWHRPKLVPQPVLPGQGTVCFTKGCEEIAFRSSEAEGDARDAICGICEVRAKCLFVHGWAQDGQSNIVPNAENLKPWMALGSADPFSVEG
jgi:hypothetical protein